MTTKEQQQVKEARAREARARLRGLFTPGDEIHTFASEFSRSGYSSRTIAVFAIVYRQNDRGEGYPTLYNVSHLVADALGLKLTDSRGVRMRGTGMDMEFHLTYSLGRELYENHPEELTPADKRALARWRKEEVGKWQVPPGNRDAGYALRKTSH